VAITEWASASPIYTRRMQRALAFEGEDVITIFKGLQLDVGAPPQFLDFRFSVTDRWHGSFHLAHCGALMDVEPIGESFVKAMCHDIEDPTFDATAVATNPKAAVRPVHRPPRTPADRKPHCEWTVTIDETNPAAVPVPGLALIARTQAALVELAPIDPASEGRCDYSGALLSDLDFREFSHSALVRIADEMALQSHLLALAFGIALREQTSDVELIEEIARAHLVCSAGIAASRLHRAFGAGDSPADAARILMLLPHLNPAAYLSSSREGASISFTRSIAHEDTGWWQLLGPSFVKPLQAAVRAVDPCLDVVIEGSDDDWTATVVRTSVSAPECDEVALTRISSGAGWEFEARRGLPLFVV